MGARFSASVQTGRGAHQASGTMGTGSFPGVKSGRGVTLTTHPLLVPWSRKSRAIRPYGLYRALVPVQGCTLPYPFLNTKLPNLQFISSVYPVSRNVLNVLGSESHMCSCCFVATSVWKNVSAVKVYFTNLFVHMLITKIVN